MFEKAVVFTVSKYYNISAITFKLAQAFPMGVCVNADKGNPVYFGVYFDPNQEDPSFIAEQASNIIEFDTWEEVFIDKRFCVVKAGFKDNACILNSTNAQTLSPLSNDFSAMKSKFYNCVSEYNSNEENRLKPDECIALVRTFSANLSNGIITFKPQVIKIKTV